MDFKWKLSRPGIELEFETGSISEAIGMLEEEGTKISEVFGFTMGGHQGQASTALTTGTVDSEPARRGRKPKDAPAAVAPAPLPVPTAGTPPQATTLPPNALNAAPAADLTIPADGGVPAFLARPAAAAPPPPLPTTAAPPLAPPIAPTAPTPPPVGVLGPKVVAALDKHKEGKTDGGQALADWLADSNLTIKGATYDEACRAVLMISDEKLKGVAERLGIAA